MEEIAEWSQAPQTVQVTENRKRAMQSNLFSDNPSLSPKPTFIPENNYNSISSNNQISQSAAPPYQASFSSAPYSNISQLHPFPDFQADLSQIPTSFDLGVHPRENKIEPHIQKLNCPIGNQMKQFRDELARDYEQFSERIRHINDSVPITMDTISFPPIPPPKSSPLPTYETPPAVFQFSPSNSQKITSLEKSEDEDPLMQTASQFLMPDGSTYQGN